jgi:hypothetical protein
MYCWECGSPNPERSNFCPSCGSKLREVPPTPEPTGQEKGGQQQVPETAFWEDSATQLELLQSLSEIHELDSKKNLCHLCGIRSPRSAYEFGVARIMSTRRDWGKTIASVAISAITLPLLGVGRFKGPGKETRARIIRLELMVCDFCKDNRTSLFNSVKLSYDDYEMHPSVKKATEISFAKIITREELKKYSFANR